MLHDGVAPYPHSIKSLEKLQEQHKSVVILSNAARRCEAMTEELKTVGIQPELYQSVISSGELAWKSLYNGHLQDKQGFYLGPARSRGLLEGLNQMWIDDIESADFILNAGAPIGNPPTTADSDVLLKAAADRDLPMICANPDLVAIRGGLAGISAGALARRYQELGASQIEYHGKPHSPIYREALALLGDIQSPQVLAIGDAFDTDIRGAKNAGLDTCLIAAGIHHEVLLPLSIDSLQSSTSRDTLPDYVCEYLSW